MINLSPFQVCPFSDVCFYYKDCKGTDEKRSTKFTCTLDFDKKTDKLEQKEEDFRSCTEQNCFT